MRIGLITESVLGHRSFAQYVRDGLEELPGVEVTWRPVGAAIGASRLPRWARNYALLAGWEAQQAARELEPSCDALVVHTHTIALFCPPVMARIPTLLSIDGTPRGFDEVGAAYGHGSRGAVVEGLKDRVWAGTFRRAAACVAWNEWTARSLRTDYGIAADRVLVRSPGVDAGRWRPRDAARRPGPVRVLFVGGDARRKGLDLLLAWAGTPPGRRCEVHVVTASPPAGAGPNVHHHPPMPVASQALVALFQDADVLALPTRADCHPFVLLEAMAVGLPVVTTRVGAVPELVVDGETGLVVPPDSLPDLARALDRLVSEPDLRRAYGAAGRARALEAFRPGAFLETLVERLRTELAAPRS